MATEILTVMLSQQAKVWHKWVLEADLKPQVLESFMRPGKFLTMSLSAKN